jgi:hypothetical protein
MMKDIAAPPYNYEITMTGMRSERQIIQKREGEALSPGFSLIKNKTRLNKSGGF